MRVIDGFGQTIVEDATVARFGAGIIFVRERLANGENILYGLPISSVEPIEINTRPCLEEVTQALRVIFLEEQNVKWRIVK